MVLELRAATGRPSRRERSRKPTRPVLHLRWQETLEEVEGGLVAGEDLFGLLLTAAERLRKRTRAC